MSFNHALDRLMKNCVTAFAEEDGFLYQPATGESKMVDAVFDHNYQLISLANGAEVSSFHPALKVHAKDFTQDIQEDDRFTHCKTGKVYLAREVHPDSGYGLVVILHSED